MTEGREQQLVLCRPHAQLVGVSVSNTVWSVYVRTGRHSKDVELDLLPTYGESCCITW